MAERIQRSRKKGWRMPDGAVYVGRPGAHGNPFQVVNAGDGWPLIIDLRGTAYYPDGERQTWQAARRYAVELFRAWRLHPGRFTLLPPPDLTDLRGRDLCCWCLIGQPCHADVLIELANGVLTPNPVRPDG